MTAATSMVSTEVKESKAPAATCITDTNPYEQHIADSPTKAAQVVAIASLRLTRTHRLWPTFMVVENSVTIVV